MDSRGLLSRLKRLERLLIPKEPPKDEDCFFQSLGVDGEAFKYDAVAAVSASAEKDWRDYEEIRE